MFYNNTLSRTKHDTYQYEGIDIVDIATWLYEEKM